MSKADKKRLKQKQKDLKALNTVKNLGLMNDAEYNKILEIMEKWEEEKL